jgi:hypothetical protein
MRGKRRWMHELEQNWNPETPRKICAIEIGKTITLITPETKGKTLLSTEEIKESV